MPETIENNPLDVNIDYSTEKPDLWEAFLQREWKTKEALWERVETLDVWVIKMEECVNKNNEALQMFCEFPKNHLSRVIEEQKLISRV